VAVSQGTKKRKSKKEFVVREKKAKYQKENWNISPAEKEKRDRFHEENRSVVKRRKGNDDEKEAQGFGLGAKKQKKKKSNYRSSLSATRKTLKELQQGKRNSN